MKISLIDLAKALDIDYETALQRVQESPEAQLFIEIYLCESGQSRMPPAETLFFEKEHAPIIVAALTLAGDINYEDNLIIAYGIEKRYRIIYTESDNIITPQLYNGEYMISSHELIKAAQIKEPVSRWVHYKSKRIGFEKGKDYVIKTHGYRGVPSEYLFTFDTTLSMLKGVKYATSLREHILKLPLKLLKNKEDICR